MASGRRSGAGLVRLVVLGAVLSLSSAAAPPVIAGPAASPAAVGRSGLPVPRFVSLKAGRVNVRVGPGEDYRIAWVFTKPGLPIEVIQEYDTWRRIRDSDGSVGWVFQSLLSGKRTAVVSPWAKGDPKPIRASASPESAITAYLEPGVLGDVRECKEHWCKITGNGFSGWIAQDQLWGVYPDESVD
jgi:SH3-like domain-containing protein